jgi:aminoglycoside phosphotransferase (APT) family kinase protein
VTPDQLLDHLRQTGHVRSLQARLLPLSGGVSSDIFLVEDDEGRFVIKRALPKLRVKDDWFADPSRNAIEQACIDYIARLRPGCVPRILFRDAAAGLFGMEYLDERYANWKAQLLRGIAREEDARRAGNLLGAVHHASWTDPTVRSQFATTPNFYALRIEPYLVTAGRRNPALQPWFEAEAQRLQQTSLALVHGDFSPKNILLHADRLVLLDCEVAWFGDPAFDTAFLLNHLFLKSLCRPEQREDYLGLVNVTWSEYARELGCHWTEDLAERIGRLLLMLMLARVDGKSPVEYLTDPRQQGLVRRFVTRLLPKSLFALEEILAHWRESLPTL